MNISCASFLVQQDPAGKYSRESRELEICLAYKTIEDERKKKEWINSITMIYWPFFILPLDQTRGIVLDGMGLTSSKLTIYPMRSIRTEDIQSVSDTSSFVRVAEHLVNQVLANYKGAADKQNIEFLPELSFLEESRPFFTYSEELEAEDEFVIKPTKRIDLAFLSRSPLQHLPSDTVIEREKRLFQEITDEINQRVKQIKEEIKQVRENQKSEKERLRKEKEVEIKERARVRDDELKLMEEKLAKGYPGAFPDPPDFQDHLSRLSSSFDQIHQISKRKLVGEALVAIKGSKNASQMLNDDLQSFSKQIEFFELEVHQFEKEIQRDKEAAHKGYESDIRKIEARFAEAIDDLERKIDAYTSDEETLAQLKIKLRNGYDKWFNGQASAREKLDRRTIRLESSQRGSHEVKLVYLPMYLIDYSSTKKERFSLIPPHLIEAGKKMKVHSPLPLANFSLLAVNHLEKKMTSRRSLETLKEHNQLRSAATQEIFERGVRAAERRTILSSKESRVLSEKYYRNFVPE
jgi:hypothetical protein